MSCHILVVDDDYNITEIIAYQLKKAGYHPLIAHNADTALDHLSRSKIDMAILDIMMPQVDGIELCRKIRKNYFFPILFLTAKFHEQDKIEGFHAGGDDYMIKPFSANELLARVEALIRRNTTYNKEESEDIVKIGKLVYHRRNGMIRVNGQHPDLTGTEQKILILLLEQNGKSLSTELIFEQVWKEKFTISSNNNVVVHIKNLRRKLHLLDDENDYIHTMWGKGYALHV